MPVPVPSQIQNSEHLLFIFKIVSNFSRVTDPNVFETIPGQLYCLPVQCAFRAASS